MKRVPSDGRSGKVLSFSAAVTSTGHVNRARRQTLSLLLPLPQPTNNISYRRQQQNFLLFFFAATAAIRLIAFDEFCARLFFVKKQKAKTEKGGDSHGWPQKTGERDVHLTGMFNGKLRKSRILFRTAS